MKDRAWGLVESDQTTVQERARMALNGVERGFSMKTMTTNILGSQRELSDPLTECSRHALAVGVSWISS